MSVPDEQVGSDRYAQPQQWIVGFGLRDDEHIRLTERLRICYYNRLLNLPWGCGVHGRALVEAWLAGGHDVLCLPEPLLRGDAGPGRAVGRLSWMPSAIHGPVQDARARLVAAVHAREQARQIQEFEPDLLITRRAYYDYCLDAIIRRPGTAYIAEVNAVLADAMVEFDGAQVLAWERRREQDYLLGASGAVCVTEEVRDDVRALGVPHERLRVLSNGVDTDLFSPDVTPDSATRRWAAGFRRVYGHAGTWSRAHDTAGLMRAAEFVVRRQPDSGFLFVGPELADLSRQPSWDTDLRRRVRCTGRVPHRDVPCHLVSAHILWASYRSEGPSPLKLYESLALGKPVVLAGGGQAASVVEESDCGTAVPRGDAAALAAAATSLGSLTSEELSCLGANGRRWVEKRHTWSAIAADFVEFATAMRTEAIS